MNNVPFQLKKINVETTLTVHCALAIERFVEMPSSSQSGVGEPAGKATAHAFVGWIPFSLGKSHAPNPFPQGAKTGRPGSPKPPFSVFSHVLSLETFFGTFSVWMCRSEFFIGRSVAALIKAVTTLEINTCNVKTIYSSSCIIAQLAVTNVANNFFSLY